MPPPCSTPPPPSPLLLPLLRFRWATGGAHPQTLRRHLSATPLPPLRPPMRLRRQPNRRTRHPLDALDKVHVGASVVRRRLSSFILFDGGGFFVAATKPTGGFSKKAGHHHHKQATGHLLHLTHKTMVMTLTKGGVEDAERKARTPDMACSAVFLNQGSSSIRGMVIRCSTFNNKIRTDELGFYNSFPVLRK